MIREWLARVIRTRAVPPQAAPHRQTPARGRCPMCGRLVRVRKDGLLYVHTYMTGVRCTGGGKWPDV